MVLTVTWDRAEDLFDEDQDGDIDEEEWMNFWETILEKQGFMQIVQLSIFSLFEEVAAANSTDGEPEPDGEGGDDAAEEAGEEEEAAPTEEEQEAGAVRVIVSLKIIK